MTDRYSVVGLWGSGNTVAPRARLLAGHPTAYSMWDGHALWGPGRPGTIERFPILVSVLDIQVFVDRYASLGDACTIWDGREVTGIGCEEACPHHDAICGQDDPSRCLTDCALAPRAVVECIEAAETCDDIDACWVNR